ncbi:MAG: glycosyltransferase [Sulfurospirillum sp.]|nr:glycosyltransferase [Sulfurospirillum sp.]
MQVKITHLTSAHSRYDTRIFLKMCLSLAKNENYQVSLVVADGKGNETKNGVSIVDIGAKSGGRISRMTTTVKKVFQKAKELNSDIYHLHDPELMPVGLKLKKLGNKVIFDIHENTDLQILEKEWIPFFLRKIISYMYRKYEDSACKKFDFLIVPQEAMYEKYKSLTRTSVIANFPNKISSNNTFQPNINKYNLLYSGSIGEARGIWNMLDLIKELQKIDSKYTLIIAGNIKESLLGEIKKHEGWKHTNYLGMLSKKEIYEVYKDNSMGLILFNNVGQYFMAYSLKLFEYMQNGMFVIMPDFGDWITFNERFQVGINVNTSNAKEVAKKIHELDLDLVEKVSKDNIKKVDEYFTWESQEKKLFTIYEEIINVDKI